MMRCIRVIWVVRAVIKALQECGPSVFLALPSCNSHPLECLYTLGEAEREDERGGE
jgi:hypothetical protein